MVTWLNPVKPEGFLRRWHHVPTNFIQENILTLYLHWEREIIPNHDLLSVIHTRLHAPCDKLSADLLTLQKVLLNFSLHPWRLMIILYLVEFVNFISFTRCFNSICVLRCLYIYSPLMVLEPGGQKKRFGFREQQQKMLIAQSPELESSSNQWTPSKERITKI